MGRVNQMIRWWAHGWEQFVEATRGPAADRLVGPNPWGETYRKTRQH